MEKHIDFGIFETWPDSLQRLVFDYSEVISTEKKTEWDNILAGKAHYNFGGEGLRRVIESDLPEFQQVFMEVGKPYLIEFPIELKEIESYQIANLAKELISFGISTMTGEKKPRIEAEGRILGDTAPGKSLKLISLCQLKA